MTARHQRRWRDRAGRPGPTKVEVSWRQDLPAAFRSRVLWMSLVLTYLSSLCVGCLIGWILGLGSRLSLGDPMLYEIALMSLGGPTGSAVQAAAQRRASAASVREVETAHHSSGER